MRILAYFLLANLGFCQYNANNPVISLGLAYDNSGAFQNAYLGYNLYANLTNNAGGLAVGPKGNVTNYNIEIIAHPINNPNDPYWLTSGSGIQYTNGNWVWSDGHLPSPSEQDRYYVQQLRLFNIDHVNFELGGTTNVAKNETYTASQQNIIDMVCCVGPDTTYQQNFPNPTVFGLQCSNQLYTQQAILTLSLRGARSIAITYSDSPFTSSTCLAAKDYALNQASTKYNLVFEQSYANAWELTNNDDGSLNYNADPVIVNGVSYNLTTMFHNVAASNPDVWIHCGALKSGVMSLKTVNSVGWRAKATLQTTAPNTLAAYYAQLGDLAHYVLAVGQWSPYMTYKDSFFGTGVEYAQTFLNAYGIQAEYVGAGAAASGLILSQAIQQVYSQKNHTPNVFDVNAIIVALRQIRTQTFFGDVQFNSYQRNIAKDPATMQLIPDSTKTYGIDSKCVLPLAYGNAEIVYPDPRTVPLVYPSPSLILGILITNSIVFIVILVIISLLYMARKAAVIKVSSPLFLVIMAGGSLFGVIGVYICAFYVVKSSNFWICMMFPYFASIAFSLIFGSLFGKTWRVMKILKNPRMKKRVITDFQVARWIIGFLILDAIILIIWTAYDPLLPSLVNNGISQSYQCSSASKNWFYAVVVGYKFIVLLYGIFLSIESRDVHSAFNETKIIAFIIYNIALLLAVFSVVIYLMNNNINVDVLVRLGVADAIILVTSLPLAIKFYIAYQESEGTEDISKLKQHSSNNKPNKEEVNLEMGKIGSRGASNTIDDEDVITDAIRQENQWLMEENERLKALVESYHRGIGIETPQTDKTGVWKANPTYTAFKKLPSATSPTSATSLSHKKESFTLKKPE